MFDNVHVMIWVVCMMMAFFLGRWLGAIDKRRFAKAVAVRTVSYEEQMLLLKIKNSALQDELDEAMCRNFHKNNPNLDVANWSFEYWCQMQGMTEQEVQTLPDAKRADLLLEWKEDTLCWGG